MFSKSSVFLRNYFFNKTFFKIPTITTIKSFKNQIILNDLFYEKKELTYTEGFNNTVPTSKIVMSNTESADFKEIEIPVPWGHISGKWWGPRDKNPVIALHGWQDNAGTFDNLAPLLPPDLALLCIDLPGHGLSSHLPPGQFYYIWWDNMIALRRVVRYLGLQRVSILGHSLGGGVGFLYAASYPDEVEKLVCIDIACPRVEQPEKLVSETKDCIDRFLKYETMTADSTPCHDHQTMLDMMEDAYKVWGVSRANCDILLRRGMKPSRNQQDVYYFSRDPRLKVAGLASFTRDLALAYAQNIKCEYLNIRAVPGITFSIPELYDEVLGNIKLNATRFEVHKVKGSHHIHLENASSIANIISTFLTTEKPLNMSQNNHDIVI